MRPQTRERLSVVFSFRNEEEVIPELLNRLHGALRPLDLEYEFIFVNDASTDRSLEILVERAQTDPCIRIVTMSNRFGVNPCFVAGMRYAQGDAVVTMDTDLQDPPEVIPQMVEKWRAGADVVYGTRKAREGESRVKLMVTRAAYNLLHNVTDIRLPVESGMFKLVSRRVVDQIAGMNEYDPFLRGVITWVGFRQEQLLYTREKRAAGRTHFPPLSKGPAKEFLSGLILFSQTPFVLLLSLGLMAMVGGFAAFLLLLSDNLFNGPDASSVEPAVILGLLTGWMGLILVGVALVGLYVARIYQQVNTRPRYIVASTFGFEEPGRADTNAGGSADQGT